MVTYFNRKDLVNFGNFLLSEERKENFSISPMQPKDPILREEMLGKRLSKVSHADVENWLEERDEGYVYILTKTTKEREFEFVKPFKNLESLLQAKRIENLQGEIRDHLDKFKVYHYEGNLDSILTISRELIQS